MYMLAALELGHHLDSGISAAGISGNRKWLESSSCIVLILEAKIDRDKCSRALIVYLSCRPIAGQLGTNCILD